MDSIRIANMAMNYVALGNFSEAVKQTDPDDLTKVGADDAARLTVFAGLNSRHLPFVSEHMKDIRFGCDPCVSSESD